MVEDPSALSVYMFWSGSEVGRWMEVTRETESRRRKVERGTEEEVKGGRKAGRR